MPVFPGSIGPGSDKDFFNVCFVCVSFVFYLVCSKNPYLSYIFGIPFAILIRSSSIHVLKMMQHV